MKTVATKKLLWQIFLVLLPIPLTALVTLWIANRPDRLYYLDYLIYEYKDFIGLPDEVEEKVEIIYDGEKIDNLSTTRFLIYNFTDKNLSDVKLHFEIQDEDKKHTLISSSLYGPVLYPKDGVHTIQSNKTNVYVFSIDSMNRSEDASLTEPFVAEFVFLGKELPSIIISTSETGIKLRNASGSSAPDNMNTFELVIYYLNRNWQFILAVEMLLLLMVLAIYLARYADKVARSHIRSSLKQYLESLGKVKLSDVHIEDIVKFVDQIIKKYSVGLEGILELSKAIIKREKIVD